MPANKLASFRYRVINNCLRNTAKQWTLQGLMDEVSRQLYEHFGIDKGISKRTFHYDIDLMRSLPPRGFDAPIVVVDGYYKYSEPTYSIDHIALSETDIETIGNAILVLNNFPKLAISEELALLNTKLHGVLAQQAGNNKIIEFEQREVKGLEFLSPLSKAIAHCQAIEVGYKPFSKETAETIPVHPYLLKQYNHRWYLIGYCAQYKNIGLYSLDRIEQLNPSNVAFIPNTFFNPDLYFKDVIGVTVPIDVNKQTIQLNVSKQQLPYLLTKPLHSSQHLVNVEHDTAVIELSIVPNYEFYSSILALGNSVEVLSPQSVRLKLQQLIANLSEKYAN